MRNLASLVGKVVLIVTSLTAAAAATAGAAAATPAFVDRSTRLRSGPGLGYHMLATLPRGTAVDVRGCRAGWCEIAWSGGRGYVFHNFLTPAGMAPVVTIVPVTPYDDGYDYPGFDFTGNAYAPTFANAPRWSHRRWLRWNRPAAWRTPQPMATPPRLDRLIGRGTAAPGAAAESQFGARPTVGSTFSDPAPRASSTGAGPPALPPQPVVPAAASDARAASPPAESR